MNSNLVSGSDWAELPKHLLDLVLEKFNLFSDYVRFSVVCVPWYCVAMENRKQFVKKLDRQLPMLLLPKKDEEKGEGKNLYDVSTNKFVNVELCVPFTTRFGGSSKGWLIAMGEDFVVKLINPISPKGAVITLPAISKSKIDYSGQIKKGILSADPLTEPNDYTVAVIYGDLGQLAFIKPGRQDVCWTFIDYIKTDFDDIIYYEGRLHAVDFEGKAFCFDDKQSVPRKLLPTPYISSMDGQSYLVESLGGDLLLVYRHFDFIQEDDTPEFRETYSFEVFKWKSSGPIWGKLGSLGEESLFLGDNMSKSILASDFPGCSPNSIYFTYDYDDILVLGDRGRLDSGVFNLGNLSFAPHYVTDEASFIAMTEQPPIWFQPNFLSKEPFLIKTVNSKTEYKRPKFISQHPTAEEGQTKTKERSQPVGSHPVVAKK